MSHSGHLMDFPPPPAEPPSDTPQDEPLSLEVREDAQLGQRSLRSLRAFAAGEVLTPFRAAATYDRPARMTLQVSEREHITLLPSVLTFTNHSCDPNAFFDVEQWRVIALRPISVGEPITFFYPSTEWTMAEPFACACGSPRCLQRIAGASQLPEHSLQGQRLNPHITRLLRHASRPR
jgi:hypothetical protein